MKKILEKLFEHETLSYHQAKSILLEISAKKYNEALISSFLTVYKMRTPNVNEIEGFRDALLELCVKVDFSDLNTIVSPKGTQVLKVGKRRFLRVVR